MWSTCMSLQKSGEQPESMTSKDAAMFPIIASCTLLGLYIFFKVSVRVLFCTKKSLKKKHTLWGGKDGLYQDSKVLLKYEPVCENHVNFSQSKQTSLLTCLTFLYSLTFDLKKRKEHTHTYDLVQVIEIHVHSM